MAFTYVTTTSRGRVRLLIADTDTADATKQIFDDDEIDAFLALESSDVYMSAAAACMSIAADTSRSAVAFRTLNMTIDRSKIPAHYRELAKGYKERAIDTVVDEYFDHADYVIDGAGADRSEYSGDIIT